MLYVTLGWLFYTYNQMRGNSASSSAVVVHISNSVPWETEEEDREFEASWSHTVGLSQRKKSYHPRSQDREGICGFPSNWQQSVASSESTEPVKKGGAPSRLLQEILGSFGLKTISITREAILLMETCCLMKKLVRKEGRHPKQVFNCDETKLLQNVSDGNYIPQTKKRPVM